MEVFDNKIQSIISFVNICKSPIFILNEEFIIEYANKEANKLFKIIKGEIVRKNYWDILSKITTTPIMKEDKDLKIEEYKTMEIYHKSMDKWFQMCIDILDNKNYYVNLIDITEKMELKEKLEGWSNIEEEYLQLLDSSTIGFYISDYEKKEIRFSRTWKERLGWQDMDERELFAKRKDLFHPDDIGKLETATREIIGERKEKISMEYRFKINKNGYLWLLTHAKIIYNNRGRPIKALGTHIDITDRKLAELARKKSEKKANKLILELRKANELKNNFISTLGHELRNPLATMSIGISLLDTIVPGGEVDIRTRKIIKRQTAELVRFVDDILNTSRIITNRMELVKEDIEVSGMIKELMEEYKPLFHKQEIKLKGIYGKEPIYIVGDYIRIKQAVGNLLSNALKFTEKGGLVEVKTCMDKKDDSKVTIQVADNGIGISPEQLPELFGTFVQSDNSFTRSTSGLGLGLPITKGIIELHGGFVRAYSEGIGKGTRFIIGLPKKT